MQSFRKLEVWRKAHALAREVYAFSSNVRHPRDYFLRNQLIRSAISIPSNLAEGCGRTGDREMRRFVRVALGPASELEYHLLLARDLGLLQVDTHERLSTMTVEIKRMLSGLAAYLTTQLETES